MRFNNAPTQDQWKNDRFDDYEKGFDSNYSSNGNSGSNNGSFHSPTGIHSKGKQAYYAKKVPDIPKPKPINEGGYKQSKDWEHDRVDLG